MEGSSLSVWSGRPVALAVEAKRGSNVHIHSHLSPAAAEEQDILWQTARKASCLLTGRTLPMILLAKDNGWNHFIQHVSQWRSKEARDSSLWSRGRALLSNSFWWLICLILHPSFIRPNQLSGFQSAATGRNSQPPNCSEHDFTCRQVTARPRSSAPQPCEHYVYKLAPPTSDGRRTDDVTRSRSIAHLTD